MVKKIRTFRIGLVNCSGLSVNYSGLITYFACSLTAANYHVEFSNEVRAFTTLLLEYKHGQTLPKKNPAGKYLSIKKLRDCFFSDSI